MKLKEIISERLNEKYYYMKHSSGLNIYLYPKLGYRSSYAIIGTNYGSIDAKFKTKDKGIIEVPDGIAHYLEHKLFENKTCNAFELYSKLGTSANAYTSFDKTAYLFSCSDNFDESLKILLNFVQSPYFTEKNVEKERGIIAQEIKMYEDNPDWTVYFNLLRTMYKNHPVKTDIAGTVESISKITAEDLYECYKAFYNLNNMSLCISGNIDIDNTLAVIDKCLKYSEPFSTERILPDEPADVIEKNITQSFDIASPVFQLGFKEDAGRERASEKDLVCTEIILKSIVSKASPIYNKLLNLGLINTVSFDCDYMEMQGMSCTIFSGESKDPEKTADIIKSELTKLHNTGIDEKTFDWAKKSVYGESISGLNSIKGISNNLLDCSFSNRELFRYIDFIHDVTLNDVNKRLESHFNNDYSTLSIVKPNER